MRSLARLLLLIAALAYGAMPMTGMPAMAMSGGHAMDLPGDLDHSISIPKAVAKVDCPRSDRGMIGHGIADGSGDASDPLKTTWHCSACLTLPANAVLPESGKPARAAEASRLFPSLMSQQLAPLTPPPRA